MLVNNMFLNEFGSNQGSYHGLDTQTLSEKMGQFTIRHSEYAGHALTASGRRKGVATHLINGLGNCLPSPLFHHHFPLAAFVSKCRGK